MNMYSYWTVIKVRTKDKPVKFLKLYMSMTTVNVACSQKMKLQIPKNWKLSNKHHHFIHFYLCFESFLHTISFSLQEIVSICCAILVYLTFTFGCCLSRFKIQPPLECFLTRLLRFKESVRNCKFSQAFYLYSVTRIPCGMICCHRSSLYLQLIEFFLISATFYSFRFFCS